MTEPWAVRLFSKSPLKRDKVRALLSFLGNVEGKRCLDLGSDNGVVSLLLRREGGSWASGDLTAETVTAIESLVGSDVHLVREESLPFADLEFDAVVVADMLEHVAQEAVFVNELARVLKPGGRLLINTPHERDTALRRFRLWLGQTDAKHGHLRPGYTRQTLGRLLQPSFEVQAEKTYTKAFSELVDTLMQWGLERLGKGSSKKGVVVTGGDLDRHRKLFAAYSAVFPVVWVFSRLDSLLPWTDGYRLVVLARKRLP